MSWASLKERLARRRKEIEDKAAIAAASVEEVPAAAPPGAPRLAICLQTDRGVVRLNNEDNGVCSQPGDPEVLRNKGTLVMVADGMGGAQAGEIASTMAVECIPRLYYESREPSPGKALRAALERASRDIHEAAKSRPELEGMGTTCVALVIRDNEAFLAYVGDSRIYLVRQGGIYQLSEDHSVVYEMVKQGIITREQARNHEDRNLLSLSLGGRPDVRAAGSDQSMTVDCGDLFLLCSDGLHDLVSDDDILAVAQSSEPSDAVAQLIRLAKEAGGYDNITVAVVKVSGAADEPPEPRGTREFSVAAE